MVLKNGCICYRGADPRAVNGDGKTPLELAVELKLNDVEILAILSDAIG